MHSSRQQDSQGSFNTLPIRFHNSFQTQDRSKLSFVASTTVGKQQKAQVAVNAKTNLPPTQITPNLSQTSEKILEESKEESKQEQP